MFLSEGKEGLSGGGSEGDFCFSLHKSHGGDCYTDQAYAGRDQIDDAHAVEEGFILSCDIAGDVLSELFAHAAVQ